MFGAYQVGAWQALSPFWQPDLVVGASAGALNAWAIAGGATPDELASLWLNAKPGTQRLHFPRSVLDGVLDSAPLEEWIQVLYRRYRPQIECGIVVTQVRGLRPRVFQGPEVTWKHLAASCGVPGVFRQHLLDGRLYSDGGLLAALPLRAAESLGAHRALAINVIPTLPWPFRQTVQTFRRAALGTSRPSPALNAVVLRPEQPLGSLRDLFIWRRDQIERWIEQGAREMQRHLADWQSFLERTEPRIRHNN